MTACPARVTMNSNVEQRHPIETSKVMIKAPSNTIKLAIDGVSGIMDPEKQLQLKDAANSFPGS